jgi:hypothetical protein
MVLSSSTVYIDTNFWVHKSNEFKRCVMRHLSRLETVVLFAADPQTKSYMVCKSWLGC